MYKYYVINISKNGMLVFIIYLNYLCIVNLGDEYHIKPKQPLMYKSPRKTNVKTTMSTSY